jgi:hypothetical protein
LYEEITGNDGLADLLEYGAIQPDGTRAFIGYSHGYNFNYKVNTTKLQEYQNALTNLDIVENNVRTILGLTPTDPTPAD